MKNIIYKPSVGNTMSIKWMTSSECQSINQELNMVKVVWLDPLLIGKLFLVRANLEKIYFLFCGAQEVLKLSDMNGCPRSGPNPASLASFSFTHSICPGSVGQ